MNPGTFDMNSMESTRYKGMTFFMTVPGYDDPELAYRAMVETVRFLQQQLAGQIIDGSRSVFTEQTFQHELEKIKEYQRRALARHNS